jgi:hypothetical protein
MAPGESQESSPGVGKKGDSAGEATLLPDNRSELQLHSLESTILNGPTSTAQRRPESITAEPLQSSAPGMAGRSSVSDRRDSS